jgi:hypothetical protein
MRRELLPQIIAIVFSVFLDQLLARLANSRLPPGLLKRQLIKVLSALKPPK